MDTQRRQALEAKTRYEPGQVEPAVLVRWLESGAFEAHADAPGEPYTIAIPPPNVTGALHMGHALNGSIQDVLIRLRRMQGCNALWLPGTDHAGIAVQNVVEKLLAQEGKTRHDLGREKFVEKVWEWKAEYGGDIREQLKRLGASLDWSARALHDGRRATPAPCSRPSCACTTRADLPRQAMINWCPRCHTALSDLEVDHKEVTTRFWHIATRCDGGGEVIVVATRGRRRCSATPPWRSTRTTSATATDRQDRDRCRSWSAQIPIVADDYVESRVRHRRGEGHPAHDPNDYEIGRRHGLPIDRR